MKLDRAEDNRPTLLKRIGVTIRKRLTLLDRLEMSGDTPLKLQTLDDGEPLLLERLGMMERETLMMSK